MHSVTLIPRWTVFDYLIGRPDKLRLHTVGFIPIGELRASPEFHRISGLLGQFLRDTISC